MDRKYHAKNLKGIQVLQINVMMRNGRSPASRYSNIVHTWSYVVLLCWLRLTLLKSKMRRNGRLKGMDKG